MPNITDAIIQQYQHPRIKLVVGGSTIYEHDIVSGSFNYRGGVTGGGAFAPGGCVISSVAFAIHNRTGTYTNMFSEGTQVLVYIGYGATPETATYDLLCTVYVSEVTKRNYKISVNAFDKLRDADKKRWTTFSFPMTVNQIISSAASEAGITVDHLPAYGGSISVDLRDDDGNQPELRMTCRQAIAQALLISGNFGYMTATGSLYCGWYSPSSADVTIPTGWLLDYSISDSQDYTGVQVYGQTPTGSTTRLYVLSSGQFITEDNCAAIQSRLYNALVGMNVFTANLSIVCNPNVRPGMKVSLTYPQAGGTVTAIIPLMSVTIKGSLRATYTSESVTTDEADDLRDISEPYATKDYVDDAVKNASGASSKMVITNTYSDTYDTTPYTVGPNGIIVRRKFDYAAQAEKIEIKPAYGYDFRISPVGYAFEVPTYKAIGYARGFNLKLPVDMTVEYTDPDAQSGTSQAYFGGLVDFAALYEFGYDGEVIQIMPDSRADFTGAISLNSSGTDRDLFAKIPMSIVGQTYQGVLYLVHSSADMWQIKKQSELPTV